MKNLFTIVLLLLSFFTKALDANHFTITRITAPYFIIDGNNPTNLNSAYVGFEVKNNSNSAVTYSSLRFTITSVTTSIAGMNYVLVSPSNGISNVGTLSPGATKVCYFYVQYPTSKTQFPTATFNITLSNNTAGTKTATFSVVNRSSISANAGGIAIQSFSSQDLIGGIVTDTVTYTVGNVQAGDETDFQVAVSPLFDPTKIILQSTKVWASSVPLITAGATDSLYFTTGNGSNGASVTIIWTFKIAGTNFTTYLLPCAGSTSGNTNYKYALNSALGSGTPIVISNNANPLTITKASDKTTYCVNETAFFTVTIGNPGLFGITIDKITDQLPAGFTFLSIDATSQITAVNSTTVPSVGNTGSITFEGGVNSGSNTSFYVPAGGTLVLKYSAIVPALAAANLTTTVKDFVATTQVGSAQNTISVSTCILPVKWLSTNANLNSNKQVFITWKVQEINVANYSIQKSNNGINFYTIGTIISQSNGENNYAFTDNEKVVGKNYYRIVQKDNDGKISYSNIMLLNVGAVNTVTVYPNPTADVFIINTNQLQNTTAALTDLSGKLLQNIIIKQSNTTVNISNYAKGVYMLKIADGEVVKIIKK
jgi:uncharacterized repeat protein (TIGR01451 family)